jgi:hypothetical protein
LNDSQVSEARESVDQRDALRMGLAGVLGIEGLCIEKK